MSTSTIFHTYVEGSVEYNGTSLEEAVRTWDQRTYALGRSVPGGISVATYENLGEPEQVQLRDGWILHVHEDGTVFLHPRLS